MVNSTEVITALTGLVGFAVEEAPNTDPVEIPSDLFTSRSGLTYQEAHPLVTIANLRDCGPEALDDTQFGQWLQRKVNGAIKKVFSEISTRKKLDGSFRDFLSDVYLYNGLGNIYNKEVRQGRFVGFQFVLKQQQGVVIQINKVGTQFDTSQVIPLYLYHTSKMGQPVKIVNINAEQPDQMNWAAPDTPLLLRFSDSEIDPGGAWFLGYYEADVAGQSLNKDNFNFTSGGCNCGGAEMDNWKSWANIVSVQPFCVMPEDLPEDKALWDIEKMNYYNTGRTWGLNFNISAYCDLLEVIRRNERTFAKVIQMQFGVDALQEIGFNIRLNRTSERVMQKAIYELDDRPNGGGAGMRTKLENELKAVSLDFSGLNKICLPCTGTRVRYGSI